MTTLKQRAEYQRQWRLRHPDRARELVRRSHDKRVEWVNQLKEHPCMDCGGTFPPECMDFDHRDPSTKVAGVSVIAHRMGGIEKVLREIAKCDLVCANCHRIRTAHRPSARGARARRLVS